MRLLQRKRFWVPGLIFLIPALLLTVEHLHGRWRLAHWKSAMIARGEKLSIPECLPASQPRLENRHRDLMAVCAGRRALDLSKFAPPSLHFLSPGKALPMRYVDHWPSTFSRADQLKRPELTNITWEVLGNELALGSNSLAEAKALLHEPRLDPELDYYMGFNLLLPHLAPCKSLARDLNIAALHELRLGHLDAALDDLKDLLLTARVLEEERTIIAQLVRQAILSIAVGTTWQALQTPGWTDAQLSDLQQAWASLEFLEPMSRAFEMERAMSIEIFRNMRGSVDAAARSGLIGSGAGNASKPITSLTELLEYCGDHTGELFTRGVVLPLWQFAWSREDEFHYLGWTQIHLDALRAAARNRAAAPGRDVEARSEEWLGHPEGLNRLRHLMSTLLAGALERSIEKSVNSEGLKELAVAAIALQRYQLRHGHPPSALDQLVPAFLEAVPRDYWAGTPLHYRLTNGVPLLYATGKNAQDDGGDPTVTEGKLNSLGILGGRDVVWPAAATAEESAAAVDTMKRR